MPTHISSFSRPLSSPTGAPEPQFLHLLGAPHRLCKEWLSTVFLPTPPLLIAPTSGAEEAKQGLCPQREELATCPLMADVLWPL